MNKKNVIIILFNSDHRKSIRVDSKQKEETQCECGNKVKEK